ncbi:MAG TPA: 4-alpha-glucanotransferase [Terriglobales bacterium]|nr:4-alpha-glucanotransferase [Terriglobales bacterium]
MERPQLQRLARACGILPAYSAPGSRKAVATSDDTAVALLQALDVDGSNEETARRELRRIAAKQRAELIDPTVVAPLRSAAARSVGVRLPRRAEPVEWQLTLIGEDGERFRRSGRARAGGGLRLLLPRATEPGYHRLELLVSAGGEERSAVQSRILTPSSCLPPREKTGRRQATGVIANLYTVRSERNWGFGDITDLAELTRWAGAQGAAFVGINPLHAIRARGSDISPYSPISRLYRSYLYIDIEAVPEAAVVPSPARAAIARLQRGAQIDYPQIAAIKLEALRSMHRLFGSLSPRSSRVRDFHRYCREQGQALLDFATYCAIEEVLSKRRRAGVVSNDWHTWPAELREPRSPAVERFRRQHREQVELHRYVQYELDRQLSRCAAGAATAGLSLGVYQDLAIGSAGNGSDVWSHQRLFAAGVSVGAPPDAYSTQGQDWGFPPLDPRALQRDGYRYWTRLLRNAFAHSGALRIDHILGLFRQYWIPRGKPATEGAYVRFPSAELLAILALESQRAGGVVVGEDLGTVPPGVPETLAKWGVLSSRVLYFEQTKRGEFRAAAKYPANALVTANTHDLPPIAGWVEGLDLELRARAGAVASEAELRRLRKQRAREVAALTRRLVAEKLLRRDVRPTVDELIDAVERFLRRTPARMIGISLDDLAGEKEPVNIPSVPPERHPSWSRRMSKTLKAVRPPRGRV